MTTPAHHLVLLAHGSRDLRWQEPFENLVRQLQTDLGAHRVSLAYMEMAEPSLEEVITYVAEASPTVHECRILPLFMAAGGHLRHDVPQQLERLATRFPHVTLLLLPPIGEHPLAHEAFRTIALAAAANPQPSEATV
ncbi:MAG: CbiX/SirB N-terminal domain-containing protein [Candidatus Melainabacteria bacterium]|nr:CbiX/SirB N-terminal domain-containing protein [Candidatus Melainabacteria bacterium]